MTCLLHELLASKLDGLPRERVGAVLKDGEVIEFRNASSEPETTFFVVPEELIVHIENLAATWHTHTTGSFSPSPEDMQMFRMWPEQAHYIISPEGVQKYIVDDTGAVLCA